VKLQEAVKCIDLGRKPVILGLIENIVVNLSIKIGIFQYEN